MRGKTIIKVDGHLDSRWTDWFDGMDIIQEDNHTLLIGNIMDEAFIHGILTRIRDLNLKLISVNPVEESEFLTHQKSK